MTVPQQAMKRVQCAMCLAMAEIPGDVNPHSRTWCGCCTRDHHHGEGVMAAEECAAANHPGQPCFSPPLVRDKPDGCTVCRPVIHWAVAGSLPDGEQP